MCFNVANINTRLPVSFKLNFIKQAAILIFALMSFSFDIVGADSAKATKKLKLYLDADFTGATASSQSIFQGIQTALSEVGNNLNGYTVEIVKKNHRGNSRRSLDHNIEFTKDTQALAVFTGLHSPPLLANRKFINQNSILTLDPWAAAGPITRYPSVHNWIFRLSVDDTKAGKVIANFAINKKKYKKPALLLEKTGWGKSNEKNMLAALNEFGISPVVVVWFNWGLQEESARILLRNITQKGVDCILLVANSPEAKSIAKAMISLPNSKRIPIISHWGLTGGDFPSVITNDKRQDLTLFFLQTSFSFLNNHQRGMNVLEQAKKCFPRTIKTAADIKAGTGFIHAYDLTKILIAAVQQTGLTGNIKQDRKNIRLALENLKQPVAGLIKIYQHPFSQFSPDDPDAHEALNGNDLRMGQYGSRDEVILIEGSGL